MEKEPEKKRYGHPDFYVLLEEMAELHSRKNHDYAGTEEPLRNFKRVENIGVDAFTGVMVRLQDKWSRLEGFMKSKELLVKGESVEDTLMDMSVYGLLAILLYREEQAKEEVKLTPYGNPGVGKTSFKQQLEEEFKGDQL